jgi:hypothetical protein
MVGGTVRSKMKMDATETVFNNDSVDLDFRVESDGNANMLFVDAGNDKVGIGTNSPASELEIESATPEIRIDATSGAGRNYKIHSDGNELYIEGIGSSGSLKIGEDGTYGVSIDLGTGGIQASDGIYLGGTGSANKLDDYEEGTWTPTLSTAVSSITVSGYTSQIGTYVKVGRLVTLTCMIQATVTAFSNDPTITGLPFAPANNRYTGVSLGLSNLILSDDADNVSNGERLAPSVRTGDIRFYFGGYNTSSADAYICFTTQYETNA